MEEPGYIGVVRVLRFRITLSPMLYLGQPNNLAIALGIPEWGSWGPRGLAEAFVVA
ncbi:hypothetical protein D3C80_1892570 [compost metagenome]